MRPEAPGMPLAAQTDLLPCDFHATPFEMETEPIARDKN